MGKKKKGGKSSVDETPTKKPNEPGTSQEQGKGGGEPQGQGRGGGAPQGQGRGGSAPHGQGRGDAGLQAQVGAGPQDHGRGGGGGGGQGRGGGQQGRGGESQGRGGRGAQQQGRGGRGAQHQGRGGHGHEGRQDYGQPQAQGRGAGTPRVQSPGEGSPQGRGAGSPPVLSPGSGSPQGQGRGAGTPRVQSPGEGQARGAWGAQPPQQQATVPQQGAPVRGWGPQAQVPPPATIQQHQPRGPPPGMATHQPRGPPPGMGQQAPRGLSPGMAPQSQHPRGPSPQQPPGMQQQRPRGPSPGMAPQQPPGMQQQRPRGPSPAMAQSPRGQTPVRASSGMAAITSKMATTGVGGGDGILIQDKISTAGSQGRKIPIQTNHFELKLGKVKRVIHYDMKFEPETPKKMLKDAYILFKKAYFEKFNPAFDGRKNVYSARELPFGDSVTGKVVVEETGMRSREFEVTMKYVGTVNLESIQQFLNQARNQRIIEEPRDAIQALDIVLRHSISLQCINVGRSFFTPPRGGQIINLGNGMEMYKGFFQSVSLGWKPFLNVDVANKAFPKSQHVISLIAELCPRADLKGPLERFDFEALNKFIKGLRVEYNLPGKPSSKKRYRVNGINGSARGLTFDYTNEQGQVQNVTIEEYYKIAYNVRLQYPHLPCLWVGNMQKEQKTYLPSEFCQILPSQPVQRKLDPNQTREMIKQCATNTDVRKRSIKTSIDHANYNRDPIVNEFDLNISTEFLNLDARVLVPPDLKYKDSNVRVQKGVWMAKNFLESVQITRWTVVNLDYRTRDDGIDKMVTFLINGSRSLGMTMGQPVKPFLKIKTFPKTVYQDLTKFFNSNKDMEIIFVVIPEEDKIYNYVKQAAELAVGCLTQCIKGNTVFKKMNPATIGNILLKVNAKLNGANHTLVQRPPIMNVPTMIMGADVTHPSPDSRDIPSVAAVTASHDPKAFRYNICWRLQPPTVEIIEDLENITKEQILYFCKMNKTWPQRIIFYRDGVSNGQFQQVLQVELQAIRRACTKINETCKPSITFIVVQKRHHTRFFPSNPRDSEDRNNNVPAGTCVDTEIVHPTRQNFFLVSHASIQGVAKPTKYVTLWDDNDFTNDSLESLTYHLCHMFARCTRSVSYPAPTYYAHLAAARAKVYIETSHLNLDDLQSEQHKLQIKENIVKGTPMFFV